MARLVGVDLPREKRLEVALTYIFGIGRTRAQETLDATGDQPATCGSRDLGDDELVKLRDWIEANYKIEGDLRREVQADIRRKVEIGCYQGIRHRRGLPVRGQRTHTNARTRKGPQQDRRRQEEGRQEVVRDRPSRRATAHLRSEGQMPPKSRQARAPRRCAARRRRTSPTATPTSRARSTTRSSRSPTRAGNVIAWASRRPRRLQGLAQVHAVRRADGRRGRRPPRAGARHAQGRRLRQGPRLRPRDRDPLAAGRPASRSGSIQDVTPVPHNGCRPPKRRRV